MAQKMCVVKVMPDPMDKTPIHVISLNGHKEYLPVGSEKEIPYEMYEKCIKGSHIESRTAIFVKN